MTDEIRVKLTIASNTLAATEVSALLGIEADSVQVQGEMNRLGTKLYSQHVWMLKNQHEILSNEPIAGQIEARISQFLDRIVSAASVIRSLSNEHFVEVGIYVFARDVPPLGLSKKQVEAIAALGASVDFDLVLYAEDDSSQMGQSLS
jgi:hypothetical protein